MYCNYTFKIMKLQFSAFKIYLNVTSLNTLLVVNYKQVLYMHFVSQYNKKCTFNSVLRNCHKSVLSLSGLSFSFH